MNRFRTKKKAKDDSGARRPSDDNDHGLSFFSRKKKAPVEEEKPQLNLDEVLPSTDEFRTSLLMTGLSARFSMLREQDDPNTKIGKASDDSVLFPKRQSRMADLGGLGVPGPPGGFGGLADIAEVESIKGSFARINSYASGSDDANSTNADSIMNRTKPVDGNNLFGGRQKIYKIPAGAKSGGLAGRAVYDDDVPMSSFQKWRQAERDREMMGMDDDVGAQDMLDSQPEAQRPESPLPVGYNRRRETSSTTSSAPSAQRNSTAATSVVSGPTQPIQPTQNWQSPLLATSTSTSTAPTVERNVMRTRRLYEQGLNQEMQDQQSSALSRIDTIARKGLGSRTPDLVQTSPSPTHAFADRLGDRRNILAKSSAPNLRSFSPPASGSSLSSTVETGVRPGRSPVAEAKAVFGAEPPLSPPVSDTGSDHPSLHIPSQDKGKATALGVFQKPAQKYDDSTYAQRQMQLQQGRESPAGRKFRTESMATFETARSRSTSSSRRPRGNEKPEPTPVTDAPSEQQTFLDDSDASPLPETADAADPMNMAPSSSTETANPTTATNGKPIPTAPERPSDSDHPFFRESALPTPLTLSHEIKHESLPFVLDMPSILSPQSNSSLVDDSPTLGPASSGSGLSGLVRAHLRSDSNTSSVYGGASSTPGPATSGLETRFPTEPYEPKGLEDFGMKSNPWEGRESQWGLSVYGVDGLPNATDQKSEPPPPLPLRALAENRTEKEDANGTAAVTPVSARSTQYSASDVDKDDRDDFARELAMGARRVRERLTSYVESDSSRAASPHDSPRDLQVPSSTRTHGLGLIKSKSSRGSLVDRNREGSGSQSKTMKMLGLGSTPMNVPASTSPTLAKQSFDDMSQLAPMKEEEPDKDQVISRSPHEEAVPAPVIVATPVQEPKEDPMDQATPQANLQESPEPHEDGKNVHAGIKAFRQARRELQRLKEVDTQTRRPGQGPPEPASRATPTRERGERQRTPSRERKPPPAFYQGSSHANNDDTRQQARQQHQQNQQSQQQHHQHQQRQAQQQQQDQQARAGSSAPSERDRSGSEASSAGGGRSRSRPARLRNGSVRHDERSYGGPHGQPPPRGPMMRSPGLPGTDIRRSPHMPPQPHPSANNAGGYFANQSNGSLQPRGRMDSGQPSPISPIGPNGIPSPNPYGHSGAATPTGMMPRSRGPSMPTTPSLETPPALGNGGNKPELVKKAIKKNEISDPTFMHSTSRVPVVNLPDNTTENRSRSSSRSRSNSSAAQQSQYAPPLPPINPRRRTDASKTRTVIGALMGRKDTFDDVDSISSPHLPLASPTPDYADEGHSAFSVSDEEQDKSNRRRLRKVISEANGMNARARAARGGSPPQVPPPPRALTSPRPPPRAGGMGMDLPGGMI